MLFMFVLFTFSGLFLRKLSLQTLLRASKCTSVRSLSKIIKRKTIYSVSRDAGPGFFIVELQPVEHLKDGTYEEVYEHVCKHAAVLSIL